MFEPKSFLDSVEGSYRVYKILDELEKPMTWYQMQEVVQKVIETLIRCDREIETLYLEVGYAPWFIRNVSRRLDQLKKIASTAGKLPKLPEKRQYRFEWLDSIGRVDDDAPVEVRFSHLLDELEELFDSDSPESPDTSSELEYEADEEEDFLRKPRIPLGDSRNVLEAIEFVREDARKEEDIEYSLDTLEEAVKEILEKAVGNRKKSELDELLIDLVTIDYYLTCAYRDKIKKRESRYHSRGKTLDYFCEVYDRANIFYCKPHWAESLDEILLERVDKYLKSPWMHLPKFTNSLLLYLLDFHFPPKYKRIPPNSWLLFLGISAIGIPKMFSIEIGWLQRWFDRTIVWWMDKAISVLAYIWFGCAFWMGIICLAEIVGYYSWRKLLKKSGEMLAARKEVFRGLYDGDELARRLRQLEKQNIYVNSLVYPLLGLATASPSQ